MTSYAEKLNREIGQAIEFQRAQREIKELRPLLGRAREELEAAKADLPKAQEAYAKGMEEANRLHAEVLRLRQEAQDTQAMAFGRIRHAEKAYTELAGRLRDLTKIRKPDGDVLDELKGALS